MIFYPLDREKTQKEELSYLTIEKGTELFKDKKRYLKFLTDCFGLNLHINTVKDLLDGLKSWFSYKELNIVNVYTLAKKCNCLYKKETVTSCQSLCPVSVDVRYFINQLEKIRLLINNSFINLNFKNIECLLSSLTENSHDFDSEFIKKIDLLIYNAHLNIMKANPLYVATASVCPAELLCESPCNSHVSIGNLESFIGGWIVTNEERMRRYDWFKQENILEKKTKKIAILGSGPAGLAAAYYLAKSGYIVSVYEASSNAGGILMNHIPEFRLPKDRIKFVIEMLESMGVKFKLNTTIKKIEKKKKGKYFNINGEDFDTYVIAIGKGEPYYPGNKIDYVNVFFETTLLKEINYYVDYHLNNAKTFLNEKSIIEDFIMKIHGKNAVAIGAGNSALDVARTLLRLHAKKVYVLSGAVKRKTNRFDKPPTTLCREVKAAQKEGVKIIYGSNYINLYCKNGKDHRVSHVQFLQNGKTKEIAVAFVVYALGRKLSNLYNLDVLINDYNQIINRSELNGSPHATGDCTTKYINGKKPYEVDFDHPHYFNNVITAISSGRKAAQAIDNELM